jgi:DNA-binding CsgD family transcriptional regulator
MGSNRPLGLVGACPRRVAHPFTKEVARNAYERKLCGMALIAIANSSDANEVDLWAPVSRDVLPRKLNEAMERRDWPSVRNELGTIMDGVTTDGAYGRALLQLALELPTGVDPVFDSYRGAASIDHGDWDGLRRCIAGAVEPIQLLGMRDVLLGPLDQVDVPREPSDYGMLFGAYEHQLSQMTRQFRRWARAMLSFQVTEVIWSRPDVPHGRHFRHRRLQDEMLLAFAEVYGGSLPTAMALALGAKHLGDETEPLRIYAPELEDLVALAMGDERTPTMRLVTELPKPTGLSPLGAWQLLMLFMPLLSLMSGDAFVSCARLTERIAARLGSPRAQLASQAWRVAAEHAEGLHMPHSELPGVRAQAERAGMGLRVLPQLTAAVISRRLDDFVSAERLARRVGSVWAQVSALTWMAALNPDPRVARWLAALLELTGWRRLVLVPPDIASDAALGLASLGMRGEAIVELASAAGRPNVLLDVALRHVDDTAAPLQSRLAAVEALGTLGTSRARDILARLARRNDELGRRARFVSQRRKRTGLTEREVEVLRVAATGATNRDIAERLSLSQHTIARHLANARAKLGAANRTEAAAKLDELEVR